MDSVEKYTYFLEEGTLNWRGHVLQLEGTIWDLFQLEDPGGHLWLDMGQQYLINITLKPVSTVL